MARATSNLLMDWPEKYNTTSAMSLVFGKLKHYGVTGTGKERGDFEWVLSGGV